MISIRRESEDILLSSIITNPSLIVQKPISGIITEMGFIIL